MSILMALVASQKIILVHDKLSPSVRPAAQKIVENLGYHDHKVSYQYQNQSFHCLTENKINYMCVTEPDTPLRTVYGFLDDVKAKFKSTFGGTPNSYPRLSDLNPTVCAKFSPQLASSMRNFNDNPDADKIGKLKTQVDTVKKVMLQNIDDIMDRGEKIDNLVEATDQLQNSAGKFEDNSRTLKRAMVLRNLKILAAIIIALFILCLIISWIACGINYSKCKSGGGDSPSPTDTPVPGGPNTNTDTAAPTTAAPTTAAPTTAAPTTAAPTTTAAAPMPNTTASAVAREAAPLGGSIFHFW